MYTHPHNTYCVMLHLGIFSLCFMAVKRLWIKIVVFTLFSIFLSLIWKKPVDIRLYVSHSPVTRTTCVIGPLKVGGFNFAFHVFACIFILLSIWAYIFFSSSLLCKLDVWRSLRLWSIPQDRIFVHHHYIVELYVVVPIHLKIYRAFLATKFLRKREYQAIVEKWSKNGGPLCPKIHRFKNRGCRNKQLIDVRVNHTEALPQHDI